MTNNYEATLLENLKLQRHECLHNKFAIDNCATVEEYEQYMSDIIFSAEDLVEEMADHLELALDEIDSKFRDYQHQTIEICVNEFKRFEA